MQDLGWNGSGLCLAADSCPARLGLNTKGAGNAGFRFITSQWEVLHPRPLRNPKSVLKLNQSYQFSLVKFSA